MTPQVRSRNLLKADGFTVATVEWFNAFTKRRVDLFGFADLFAVSPGKPPKLVQVTSGSNVASRRTKIIETPAALVCLQAGMEIEVHGWRKLKSNGGRFAPRILQITESDFS